MKKCKIIVMVGVVLLVFSLVSFVVYYDDDYISVVMKDLKIESSMGIVKVSDYDDDGVVFIFNFKGLISGIYGFYIYENGDCLVIMKNGKMVFGGVVGGYFDFEVIGQYKVFWLEVGYEGDLFILYVDESGNVM